MADHQRQQVLEKEKSGQNQEGSQREPTGNGGAPEHRPANQDQEQDSEARKRADPRRKRTIRFVLLAFLVVAVIVAIPIYAYYSVRESTDDAQVDGHVIPISPRINGTIQVVLVNDNQEVKAGQELVGLDPADYQVALNQAEAQLASSHATTSESQENVPITTVNTTSSVSTAVTQVQEAQAAVAAAQQAINVARAKLSSSNADVAQRKANLVKAQHDLKRYSELVQKDEISKQDYDAAVAAADANAAEVQSAEDSVVQAQHSLDQANAQYDQSKARLATAQVQRRQYEQTRAGQQAVSVARYKQAQASVQQRQADLEQARLNLSYTTIRAPVDGIVSKKSAEPGMQVSAGQQIMAVIPLDDVWVTANFKETQLKKMTVGQKVEIEVDTYGSSRKYRAHIDSIAAASGAKFSLLPPENATGNYVKVVQRVPVKIVLEPGENRDHRLLPGMSVVPTVLLNSGTNNAY
ncbi:MAG: HlyD family secretion protein [Acidobacteriaceae bacterium]|nr:HlyD family secretion protein [Acidobacteriaceae bacterium]MBV9444244.1 HlyD family secretion protein [Acidobacteriaceae bacterium]